MPSSPGSPGGHSKRSNLFVLRIWRVWREDVAGTLSSTEGEDDGRGWQWEGRIQRAVSGQEHHFQGWPDFIEILEEMLADAQQVSEGAIGAIGAGAIPRRSEMASPTLGNRAGGKREE